jgi:hypothetical protein
MADPSRIEHKIRRIRKMLPAPEGSGVLWQPGILWKGDTERAGEVDHEGDTIGLETFRERLREFCEEHGRPGGIVRVDLHVQSTEADGFENDVYEPGETRPA